MKAIIQIIRHFVIINMFLLIQQTFAQLPEIHFNQHTTSDGLAGDNVLTMLQDKQGYLWIGTFNGLSRFDGYSFKNYYHKQNDSNSLSFNFIQSIRENSDGKLWIGTYGGGLNLFDPVSETFERINLQLNDSTSLNKIQIYNLVVEKSGIVWISSMNGFFRFDPKTNRVEHHGLDEDHKLSLSGYYTHLNYITKEGIPWFLAGNPEDDTQALSRYDPPTDSFIRYSPEEGGKYSFPSEQIRLIADDNKGNLFVGTKNSTLYWFNKEKDIFEPLLRNNKYNLPYAPIGKGSDQLSYWVTGFHQDKNGNYWVATVDGGINFFESSSNFMQHLTYDSENFYSLSTNDVHEIYEDNQGTIWVCTRDGGLNKVVPSHESFIHYTENTDMFSSLEKLDVNTMLQDSFGKIWLGTDSGEIYMVSKSSKLHINLPKQLDYSPRSIFAICEDSQNRIWVGTGGKGLISYTPSSGKLKRYLPEKGNKNGLSHQMILTLAEGVNNNLWIGVGSFNGVDKFDLESEFFKNYRFDETNKRSLSNNVVKKFLKDSENNFWLATSNGLNLYNPKGDDFDRFLPEINLRSMYEDSKGRFWISTQYDGLILFDRKTGEFEKFTVKDGLLNDFTNNIIEDNDGFIWISTPNGLTRLDPESMTLISFGKKEGLDNRFTHDVDAVVKLNNGELIFYGTKSIATIYPESIGINVYSPEVIITDITVFNKSLKKNGVIDSTINLDYDQNDLAIDYVGLHFKNPAKNKFSVKLEPYEEEWQQPNKQRRVRYTNLSPGEYTFSVKASNSDGIWNEEGKSLSIIISPPLWATTWAYIGYLAFILGFLYSLRKFELNRRAEKENKRLLEAENKRKSEELEEARQLQLSMLPKELPSLPNLDIAVYMKTATEVGGDYYDFHVGLDGTLTVVIGDATGHGMKAGTIVTAAKSLFNSYASNKDILFTFKEMTRCIKQMHMRNLSMCLTMLKINEKNMKYSSAGMPPIYLFRCEDSIVEEHLMKGMPLGSMNNFPYEIGETALNPGDTILLMSDGFPELKNGNEEMYGFDRAKNSFQEIADKPPEEIINHLKEESSNWMNGNDPDDDVTFVVIKVK